MGRGKKYDGYKAFQYLKAGFDYKEFKLSELKRLPSYVVPLSRSEEERFENIVAKNILISLHDHPVLYPVDMSQAIELNHMGRNFLPYEALSVSGLDCIFDNLMDGISCITSYMGGKWTDAVHDIGMRLSDIHHQDMIVPCIRLKDISDAHADGKIGLVFCLESASPIENELDRIDVLFGLGVRSMGICYSESNMLGGGMKEKDRTAGLTDFGYDAVRRMNRLGMLIDVAHANDKTALDTIEASDKPIVNSHSGPAAIARGHTTSDEVLHALAEKDGMIGIGGASSGYRTAKNPEASIESYMECVEYCFETMGIDHVGSGPDSLYGKHRDLRKSRNLYALGHYDRQQQGIEVTETLPPRVQDPGYVKGLDNPNEFVNIVRWMITHGYSDTEISKVVGGNVIRLLEKVWS